MPFHATVLRVMIGSPSDVSGARRAAAQAIAEWNSLHAAERQIVLLPLQWETHSTPSQGERGQAMINRQVVALGDIMVGIFWGRLGQPTGIAESGTVEEIREFIASGKPVLIYFCRKSLPQPIDYDQYRKLSDFREECRSNGLTCDFRSNGELRGHLVRHLLHMSRELSRSDLKAKIITTSINDWTVSDILTVSNSLSQVQSLIATDHNTISTLFPD